MNEFSVWHRWRVHLSALGVGEAVEELLKPGSPVAFLTAQALRVAQPTLSAFTDETALASLMKWADQLEAEEADL